MKIRQATASEAWDLVDLLNQEQVELLKTIPPPSSSDQDILFDTLSNIQLSIREAEERKNQIAGLISSLCNRKSKSS
ncbi:hypothetical protein [Azonexus sp. IMCC34839]|uniref:hypothetical protein n=1 Tax=Azonexus sp. IMCC34839 TaxID=3133695 RepID=UPI003999F12C